MKTVVLRTSFGLALLIACAAGAAEPVLPQTAESKRAQSQLEAGDFEDAVKTIEAALAQPELSDLELAELYRLLGLARLYLGDQDAARAAYEKLLQARPDYELPKTEAPKIRALYARIKEDIKKRRVRPVVITFEPVTQAKPDEPLPVRARIEALALGSKAKLYYRRAGRQAYSSVDFQRDPREGEIFTATLPAIELPSEDRAYELEYYLEVADAAQRRLAGRGDALAPLALTVAPRKAGAGKPEVATEAPWYKSPWLWVGVGAVAVGAATGAVIVATSRPTTTLDVNVRWEAARFR